MCVEVLTSDWPPGEVPGAESSSLVLLGVGEAGCWIHSIVAGIGGS